MGGITKIAASDEKIEEFFVNIFLQAHAEAPEQIILDLDATDDTLHGRQEVQFLHGYYGGYCYLPLYVFCGDFLLCAKLQAADKQPAAGALSEIKRIISKVRRHWPEVRILVRGDSDFCRGEIRGWCESQNVRYLFGLARNKRLEAMLSARMSEAKKQFDATGTAARVFSEMKYQTLDSWSWQRRVVGKAEYLEKGPNPRFVVTNLSQ